MPSINDMTVGSPTRDIIKFSLPLVGGYILQQMYLLIDAAIVAVSSALTRWRPWGRRRR